MSRRIDIELTSARPDGSWTWRAAGARAPKGSLDGGLVPAGAKVGSVLKADADFELDGITILALTDPKAKNAKSGLLELIPSERPFEEVTQVLARRDRGERGDRGDRGPRRERGDRPGGPRGDRPGPRGDRPGGPRGDRTSRPGGPGGERTGGPGGDRAGRPPRDRSAGPGGDRRPPREGGDGDGARSARPERRQRPSFTPPPELPQRPKAKRLKPGRAHRSAVLADLAPEQRPVAERALQGGIPAVRQAVQEQNARLRSEGKDEIPAGGVVAMAEQLLPKLRVADWLDRADAAKADLEDLDLRDLRSVVAAADDPMVSRDEETRALAAELKQALVAKQEKELQLWFTDIDAAIGVGRVIRALKLSSQPPKAGIRFPVELAKKLSEAATASLTADALSDRWSALLEAVAFSPVRTQVNPTSRPENPSDDLVASVTRLAPLLPQVAVLFGIEVKEGAQAPKPLRPTRPDKPAAKKAAPTPPRPAKVKADPQGQQGPAESEATDPDTTVAETAEPSPAAPDTAEASAAAEPDTAEPSAAEPSPAAPDVVDPSSAEMPTHDAGGVESMVEDGPEADDAPVGSDQQRDAAASAEGSSYAEDHVPAEETAGEAAADLIGEPALADPAAAAEGADAVVVAVEADVVESAGAARDVPSDATLGSDELADDPG
jgi:hypothetical protein